VSVVDTSATLRTQKAQQMAVASAAAMGRAPGVVAQVRTKKKEKKGSKFSFAFLYFFFLISQIGPNHQLGVFVPAVGDTVEALIGANWQRVMVVGTQDDGYLVSASEGSPQMYFACSFFVVLFGGFV